MPLADALALLEAELLAEALLDEALLEEVLLEEAVFSSSEKSTSSGGSPSLLLEGSGGIRRSSDGWSDSLYTGDDGLLRALESGMPSPAELRRCEDDSPLRDAVLLCWLDSRPDSMLGIEVFGWLLVAPGMLWLRERDELVD